jgi:hypothetical protein
MFWEGMNIAAEKRCIECNWVAFHHTTDIIREVQLPNSKVEDRGRNMEMYCLLWDSHQACDACRRRKRSNF